MKILRVGDPHAKVNNLAEMRLLVNYILQIAEEHKVDRVELLGDLFHTHAVLRLEVQEFWTNALTELASKYQTIVLVGNHDLSGDYASTFSALSIYAKLNTKNLVIVEKPTITGNVGTGPAIGYMPYTHDIEKFIEDTKQLAEQGATVLVCHQTIEGSKYDSGLYASDGVPMGEWSKRFKHVISGHIHTRQEFGNVIYPGTARWDTVTDANQKKGIWVFTHETDGTISGTTFISTENVCTPLYELIYKEGEAEPAIPSGRVSLLLEGTSDWVSKTKEKFKGKVSLRSKITDVKQSEKRSAGNNFEDFVQNLFVTTMDRTHLIRLAKEYGIL